METAAPWECYPAAEVRCFDSSQAPMKGRLERVCRRAEQDKAVTATEKKRAAGKTVRSLCFCKGAKKRRSRNTNIHICNFLSSQLSAPPATTSVHTAFTCTTLQKLSYIYIYIFFFAYWDCLSAAVSNSALILRIKGLQKKKKEVLRVYEGGGIK